MRTHTILPIVALAMICNSICPGASEPKRTNDSILRQTFDLAGTALAAAAELRDGDRR